jgi:hypothetical protein
LRIRVGQATAVQFDFLRPWTHKSAEQTACQCPLFTDSDQILQRS